MGAAGDRKFKQAKVWRLLRAEPMSARELADRLGVTTTAANHVLHRMERHGFVSRGKKRRNQAWTAIGSGPPEDMRGTSVGSLNTLMWTISNRQQAADKVKGGRDSPPKEAPAIPSLATLLLG